MTEIEHLEQRIADLEDRVEQQSDRIDSLENELEAECQSRQEAQARVQDLETTVEHQDVLLDALRKRLTTTRGMIGELQSRELEKGAHLHWDHIKPTLDDEHITVPDGRVEQIRKEGGKYVRLPEQEDPLDRGGSVKLPHGDLLPIQQLAHFDESTLRSVTESKPDRLAAQVWQARQKPTDDLWRKGCNGVEEYLDAGDLATWIRIQEQDVSQEYATKLARRTIDALLDLSKHRLYDELRSRRADGLTYKERRLVLPAKAEIPGESRAGTESTPSTAGVTGD